MTETFIQSIKFDEKGLIPAIVQDARSRAVLTLCYFDNTSLISTLRTGQVSTLTGAASLSDHALIDIRLNQDGSSLTVLIESDIGQNEEKPVSLLATWKRRRRHPHPPYRSSMWDQWSLE